MGWVLVLAFEGRRSHLEFHARRVCYLDGACWSRWTQSVTSVQRLGRVMEDLEYRLQVRALRGEIGGFVMMIMVVMLPLVARQPRRLVAVHADGAVLRLRRELRLVSS